MTRVLLSRLPSFDLAEYNSSLTLPSPTSLKMRYALALASLASIAAAAPMKQAGDNRYIGYVPYAGYKPYSAAVEAEAAKMNMALEDANMAIGLSTPPLCLAVRLTY